MTISQRQPLGGDIWGWLAGCPAVTTSCQKSMKKVIRDSRGELEIFSTHLHCALTTVHEPSIHTNELAQAQEKQLLCLLDISS